MDCIYEYRVPAITSERRVLQSAFPPHFHRQAELLLVTDGILDAQIDGTALRARKGDLLVVFPNLIHAFRTEYAEFQSIMFCTEICYGFDALLREKKPEQVLFSVSDVMKQCADGLHRTLSEASPYAVGTAVGHLGVFLGEICAQTRFLDSAADDNDTVYRLFSYCSEHFREPITVQSAADALFISRSYVSYLFNRKLQYRFPDYINYLRLCEAEQLLLSTEMSVTEIMHASGFRNQSTFNRIFRETYHMLPREYRRANAEAWKNRQYVSGNSSISYFPPINFENIRMEKKDE